MDVQAVAAVGIGTVPTFGAPTDVPGTGEQSARPAPPAEIAVSSAPQTKTVGANAEPAQPADQPAKAYAQLAAQFEVSFRVEHHPNMVVTVFRDAKTGEEIAQFPPEVMVALAQFFQKLAGTVVDRSA